MLGVLRSKGSWGAPLEELVRELKGAASRRTIVAALKDLKARGDVRKEPNEVGPGKRGRWSASDPDPLLLLGKVVVSARLSGEATTDRDARARQLGELLWDFLLYRGFLLSLVLANSLGITSRRTNGHWVERASRSSLETFIRSSPWLDTHTDQLAFVELLKDLDAAPSAVTQFQTRMRRELAVRARVPESALPRTPRIHSRRMGRDELDVLRRRFARTMSKVK